MNNLESVNIYTDGACSGNPGPGGWGVLIKYQDREVELMGGEFETTNNRMEMMAAIMALESLKSVKKVNIHTDSTYLRDGITKWIIKWKDNGEITTFSPSTYKIPAASDIPKEFNVEIFSSFKYILS